MMAYPKLTELNECPLCGSIDGYELTVPVTGHVTSFLNFDGTYKDEQSENMYNNLRELKQPSFVRCNECKETIAKNDRH